ncbi:MAG: hypothetical protein ABW215_07340 [Kibdelosporangium sp.]
MPWLSVPETDHIRHRRHSPAASGLSPVNQRQSVTKALPYRILRNQWGIPGRSRLLPGPHCSREYGPWVRQPTYSRVGNFPTGGSVVVMAPQIK